VSRPPELQEYQIFFDHLPEPCSSPPTTKPPMC
jgi:hypothetical protein